MRKAKLAAQEKSTRRSRKNTHVVDKHSTKWWQKRNAARSAKQEAYAAQQKQQAPEVLEETEAV